MIFYLAMFGSSIALFYVADNTKFYFGKKKTKKINYLCAILAISIPCFFAGVRDSTIGFDMQIYGDVQFEYASHFSSYFKYITTYVDLERLYQLVVYLGAHFGNRYIYYFILQFLTIFPFYLLLQEECKKETWIGMFIYFMWMYPFSLNIMRQSIAIAIVVWGYRYIKRRQAVKYAITILVALGFHTTAILGIIPYVINLLIVDSEGVKKSKIRSLLTHFSAINKFLIIIGSLAVVLFGSQIIIYFSEVTGRYNRFVLDIVESSGFNISNIVNLFIMAVVLLCLYQLRTGDRSKEISYLLLLIGVGAIIYQLKAVSSQMYRLSMYLSCYTIWLFPYLFSRSGLGKRKKQIYFGIFSACMIFNYWYFIIFRLWHSVYPYTSQFLGIG